MSPRDTLGEDDFSTKVDCLEGETIAVDRTMTDRLPNSRAAIRVTSKSAGQPIIVERSMYWNNRGAGTDTIGGFSD